jgi:hypothetical protein
MTVVEEWDDCGGFEFEDGRSGMDYGNFTV